MIDISECKVNGVSSTLGTCISRTVLSTGGGLFKSGTQKRHSDSDSTPNRCILCKPVTYNSIRCKLLHGEGACQKASVYRMKVSQGPRGAVISCLSGIWFQHLITHLCVAHHQLQSKVNFFSYFLIGPNVFLCTPGWLWACCSLASAAQVWLAILGIKILKFRLRNNVHHMTSEVEWKIVRIVSKSK